MKIWTLTKSPWRYWVIPGLTFSVLGLFSVAGEWVIVEFLILWLLGAILGRWGSLALGFRLKHVA